MAGTASPAPTTTPGTVTTTGTVAGLFSGGFTLNQGPPHGNIHVYTNSSTVIQNPVAVGMQVQVIGTGTVSTSITATSVSTLTVTSGVTATATPSPTPEPIPVNTPTATSGTVAGLFTGGFTLNQGPPHGSIHIYTNASTAVVGSPIVVGEYTQVSGTGTPGTSITAAIVTTWSAAPASSTATGTIVAGTPWGFTLNVDASHTAVPIVLQPSTVIAGGVLQAGSQATVSGVGNTSGSITATQVVVVNPTPNVPPTPTPAPITQKHLVTSDYLGAPNGNGSVTWAQAAPYDTWAQSYVSNATALRASGIRVQVYANPNRTQSGDPMQTSDETTYAHDCSGNRVTDQYKSITQSVMDPTSSSMQTLFRNTVLKQANGATVDAYFVDDSGPLSDFGNIFSPSLPCNYSDSQWISGGIALNNAAPSPVIINGLNVLNGHNPSLSIGLLDGSNTIGGSYEHCYSDVSAAEVADWVWTATENTELQVTAKKKIFQCESLNTTAAQQSYAARTYLLASFLLTYDPNNTILWEMFGTASGLHALPETALVPLNPVVATPASVSSLLLPGGAYGREYTQCFIGGNFVGRCAVAVNPSSSASATFPYPQYTHTLVMNGSDVLDGGSIATNGPAAPQTLPPLSSAIVFP
jgi:hypothetical protein